MSKAFVIKNKEGKYLISIDSDHKGHFGKDLFSAEKFHCKSNAKDFCPKDCEVVEITIAKGDLEQQLAEKCKEVNTLRDKLKDLKEEITECYVDGQDYVELREQKDKEIEELKEHIKFLENKCLNEINVKLVGVTKEKMQQIRKQVCETIRNYIDNKIYDRFGDQGVDYLTIDLEEFEDLLQDLEQTKENLK